jgi:hypothetical protein
MSNLPLRIIHLNKPPIIYWDETVKAACSALSMKPGETALLLFYCEQASGFRPSINLITKRTGLGKRAILRNRQLLIEDGLIAVWKNCIFIDWSRIALFATLDRSMVPKQRSKRTVAPVVVRRNARRFTDRFLLRCHSMPVDSLCSILSSMSDEDFIEWKSGMSRIGKTISRGA